MKAKRLTANLRSGGILRWSTLCILAGLTGCEERYVVTEKDVEMAGLQKEVDRMDSMRTTLMSGRVPNNFHVPGVGYYHAEARDFFPYAYDHKGADGQHYINGKWEYFSKPAEVTSSEPTVAALKKVDAALAEKEKEEDQGGTTAGATAGGAHHRGGFDATDALLMYWMLSGNRGNFTPGAGFRQAESRYPRWQRDVEEKRSTVSSYTYQNPGYQAMAKRSAETGSPVKAGQSVRGGFGSSRSGSGGFFGG